MEFAELLRMFHLLASTVVPVKSSTKSWWSSLPGGAGIDPGAVGVADTTADWAEAPATFEAATV